MTLKKEAEDRQVGATAAVWPAEPKQSRLLSHTRRRGFCRCFTHELFATVVGGGDSPSWRRFLLRRDALAAVVDHVVAVSRSEAPDASPLATLGGARDLVVAASAHGGPRMVEVLRAYLSHRAHLPKAARSRVDMEIRAGKSAAPKRAIAFARELRRAIAQGRLEEVPEHILDHWYGEALSGRLKSAEIRKIPAQLAEAAGRLLAHAKQNPDPPLGSPWDKRYIVSAEAGYAGLYEKYAPVFTAPNIRAAVDIVVGMQADGLRIDVEVIGPFLQCLPKQEVMRRFKMLAEWMGKTYVYDVVITPVLADFLSQPGDFPSMLAELDRLLDETRNGRFRLGNEVHRDLEFRKFTHENNRLHGTRRTLPYLKTSTSELYRSFKQLPELRYDEEDRWSPDEEHLSQMRRAAYEAAGFLRFLRRFRAGTSRPIVVVGNNRYGRQWVVEPLEQLLGEGFTVRYDGVPSHMSMRFTVPSARNFEQSADNTGPWTSDMFPMEFVRRISKEMPHFVIVDGKSPGGYSGLSLFSRAAKNYAHWFAVFNDVRSEGGTAEHTGCLPADHLRELRHWYEFVRLSRQLSEWVTPGPTYNIGLWAPGLTETAKLGEIHVQGQPPELDTDEPQVVLANPMIYDTDSEHLPEALRDTRPYYFDGPERYVREEIVFGFGPYGFQPAVRGTMTATFVAAVQRQIKAEVARLLSL